MTGTQRTLGWMLLEVISLVGLQFALSRWLVDRNAVAVIFSLGQHAPKSVLLLAGLFMAIRFLVIFLLPGFLLARMGVLIVKNRLISPPSNMADHVSP